MVLEFSAIAAGLALLVWSADRFVDGAAAIARHFGMPPLLIGMVIVGFGTSAPEMVVSSLASIQENPGLALGNAYGSNITNIALILGLTALLRPIAVHSQVLCKELPILLGVSLITLWQLWDLHLSRADAAVLFVVFFGIFGWTIWQVQKQKRTDQSREETDEPETSLPTAFLRFAVGLALLVASSRLLVWGAVELAHRFGVSDLVIGLTIIAIGTSLPELASSISAALKKEDDIALGNILGSNLFNTLAVVGIAGTIHPLDIDAVILRRDISVMIGLTLSLFIFGYGFKGAGRINRWEGAGLCGAYLAYNGYLYYSTVAQ